MVRRRRSATDQTLVPRETSQLFHVKRANEKGIEMATHTPIAGKLNTEITTGTRELDPTRQSAARLAAETLMSTLDPAQGHTFYVFLQESRVGRNELKDKAKIQVDGVLKRAHDDLREGLWGIADTMERARAIELTDPMIAAVAAFAADVMDKIELLVGKRRDVDAAATRTPWRHDVQKS